MIKRLLLAIALAIPLVSSVGCGVTPVMGISVLVDLVLLWKDGNAKKYYTGKQANVYPKLKQVLHSMGHTIAKDSVNSKGVNIIESHSAGHRFSITVAQYDPDVVLVTCRIDFMGDKYYAELMYRQLDSMMGVRTTMVIDNGVKRSPLWHRLQRQ